MANFPRRQAAAGLALGAGAAIASAAPAAAEMNFFKVFEAADKSASGHVVTDLDSFGGDGWPDLVRSYAATNLVAAWPGQPLRPGRLGPPISSNAPAGSAPDALAAADTNADGNMDVVVVTKTPKSLARFPGVGDGRFGAPVLTPITAAGTPEGLDLADVNGDGFFDAAVALRSPSEWQLFAGASGGSLTPQTPSTVASTTNAIDLHDVSGDGRPDAVVLSDGNVSVSRAQPAFAFDAAQVIPVAGADTTAPDDEASLAIGDVNGDGRADIVAAVPGDPTGAFAVLRNTSSGGALSFAAPTVHTSVPGGTRGVAVGDLDGDGNDDVAAVVAAVGGPVVQVMLARGSAFETSIALPAGGSPGSALIADMDRDGQQDVIAAGDPLRVYLNISTGALSVAPGSLGFPKTAVGMVSPVQKATFTNIGHGPHDVGTARFEGDGAGDYDISANGCTGVRLLAQHSCDVVLRFAPSAVGPRAATLRVDGLSVGLSGEGTTGPLGPQGPAGPGGSAGPPGPQGKPGRDARVTCTPKKRARIKRKTITITCRVRLATPARVSARLSRKGRVVARGNGFSTGVRLAARRLPAGVYEFTIVYRERGKRVRRTSPVTIR